MAAAVRGLIAQQEPVIYFVYGLVYFLTGFAVLLQARSFSALKSARYHYLLGIFGLVHGLADWGPMFIRFQTQVYGLQASSEMWFAYIGLLVLSFFVLYYFGVNILAAFYPRQRWMRFLPVVSVILWLAIYWLHKEHATTIQAWHYWGSTWARYLMALPGSLLTAVGLYIQAHEVRQMDFPKVANHLVRAALFFVCYAFFAGVIGPPQPFFPASWLNQNNLAIWTGLPVQVFRAFTGLAIAYTIIRYLEIFSLEMHWRLEVAERNRAALEERERIGRDIHDGVLQSLYGLRMRVEHCLYLLRDRPSHPVEEHLRHCMDELVGAIGEIRRFISGGDTIVASPGLSCRVKQLLHDFEVSTGAKVEFSYDEGDEGWTLSPGDEEHLIYLVREALSNVAKHAHARRVELRMVSRGGKLNLVLKDDGCGFSLAEQRRTNCRGLENMAARAKALGGRLRLETCPGAGTRIEVEIPRRC